MITVLPSLRRLFPSHPRPASWEAATDAELAVAARIQDRAGKEAFVEIVRRHQTTVAAVAYGVTGRIGLTDDIAQETFLRAWKRLGTLREPGKLKAWLAKIAHDCAVDALRREKPALPLDEETLRLTESTEPSPDAAVAAAEDEALVWSALAELPETLRLPLVLFYREGKSVAAVAVALDLSEDAVKQRLSRGREALREQVTSRIEGVLGRVRPNPLLVVTIAAAIGLLAGPSALAAGAFSGAATTATATGGGSSAATASTFSTAMTASSYLVATITAVAFIPLGWKAREPAPSASAASTSAMPKLTPPADPFGLFANSVLLREWRRLHEIHGTDAAAMPGLYKDIAAVEDAFQRRALRSALLAEWAVVDPAGGFRHLLEKKQNEHATQMMREWLALDPAAAASHLAANVKGAEGMARELLREIAALAPEQMVEIARQLPAPREGDRHMAEAFAVYAAKNLDAARAAAGSLTGASRASALTGVAQIWAEKDGDAALEWASSFTEGSESDGALRGVLIGWAKSDPIAALNNLETTLHRVDKTGFYSNTAGMVLEVAAEKNLDATIAWLVDKPGKIRHEMWPGLSSALDKKLADGPENFMSWMASQPEAVRSGLATAFDSMIVNNGYPFKDAIWNWLEQQPRDKFTDNLRGMVLRATAWKDPTAVIRMMEVMPDNPEAQRIFKQNITSLVDSGNLRRIEEFLAVAPETIRPHLLASAFQSSAFTVEKDWSLRDLEPWMQRLNEVPVDQRAQAAGSLASRIAADDPQAAAQWAVSLTDPDARHSAINDLTVRWVGADSYEASEWAASLPVGADRDAAAQALASSIAGGDPESAWAWAAAIGDGAMRLASLQNALSNLKEHDPSRARQVLDSAALSAGERATLQRVLESAPAH